MENIWLQQDGVICHITRVNMALCQEILSWRYQLAIYIRRFDTIRLFLWGYTKYHVYADKPSTLGHIKTNIRQAMAEVLLNICLKVVENYLKRIIHNANVQTVQ